MMKSQGLCDTTWTERFEYPACKCGTYRGNKGPCAQFYTGLNHRCVLCDHTEQCHEGLWATFTVADWMYIQKQHLKFRLDMTPWKPIPGGVG